jgi:enoyl-CoA hydratase/carnithine racemase
MTEETVTGQYRDLRIDRDGAIAVLRLTKPAKLNAVSEQNVNEIAAAFDKLNRDDSIRAVIMTGEGRGFCAGADISAGFEVPKTGDPGTGEGIQSDPGGMVALQIFRMQKPVIGAINGAAIGFGASVLLPMDYRIASSSAKFAFPFTRRAIAAESCSSWFLPRIVGIPTALSWMISGRTFAVQEAYDAGLVQEVVEPESLIARAKAVAHSFIDDTSPTSVGLVRHLLWNMIGENHPQTAHAYESRALVAAYRGADYEEGYKSFLEKRPPRFASRPAQDLAFIRQWRPSSPFDQAAYVCGAPDVSDHEQTLDPNAT